MKLARQSFLNVVKGCLSISRKIGGTADKMSNPKRYFVNNLPDYRGGEVSIPVDVLKDRITNFASVIFSKQKLHADDCDGGLYTGVAGVSYMCYYLSQQPHFQNDKQNLMARSENYLKHALSYVEHPQNRSDKSMQASFVLGAAGTYVVAAILMDALGMKNECDSFLSRYAALADGCLPRNFLRCGSDELFVGRAGYLCGVLYLRSKMGIDVISREKVLQLCQTVVDSGKEYARRTNSPCPLMYSYYNTEYLGAAHGLCSILQVLLSFPEFLDSNSEAEGLVKGAVDFLLSVQTASGNFPCAMDEVACPRHDEDELVHWCHGAPGVVYLMVKAYLRWKDSRYLQSSLSCGELTWKKGLLKKGPGICHGIAGSGYVFLLLYRLTKDPKHLHRALQCADFLFSDEFQRARTPDRPYSLYEGIAGTVCFLGDLLQPDKACFPFSDVL